MGRGTIGNRGDKAMNVQKHNQQMINIDDMQGVLRHLGKIDYQQTVGDDGDRGELSKEERRKRTKKKKAIKKQKRKNK